jgi:hypothetical protein
VFSSRNDEKERFFLLFVFEFLRDSRALGIASVLRLAANHNAAVYLFSLLVKGSKKLWIQL